VKSVRWMMSYILVATLGLGLAFTLSVRFMKPAHSQEGPNKGDLPPEFMKEIENQPGAGAPPPPPGQPQAGQPPAQKPPSIPGTSPAPTQQQPPPPPQPQAQQPTAQVPQQPPQQAPQPTQPQPPPQQMPDGVTAQTDTGVVMEEYVYDPTGKRDPFKPFKIVRAKEEAPLEPIQKFELGALNLVGILWDVRTPRAIVKDPDGKIYTIVRNSKMGRHEGFVAAIREGEVVVIETLYEDGKTLKEARVLELKK
jgi:type IV pilus assembly protein PilP